MPGFIFSERICGTNGIGTCLHCAAPVELVGAEHYCAHDHVWYCSAAPIFDSKANLLGVFNISISRESFTTIHAAWWRPPPTPSPSRSACANC